MKYHAAKLDSNKVFRREFLMSSTLAAAGPYLALLGYRPIFAAGPQRGLNDVPLTPLEQLKVSAMSGVSSGLSRLRSYNRVGEVAAKEYFRQNNVPQWTTKEYLEKQRFTFTMTGAVLDLKNAANDGEKLEIIKRTNQWMLDDKSGLISKELEKGFDDSVFWRADRVTRFREHDAAYYSAALKTGSTMLSKGKGGLQVAGTALELGEIAVGLYPTYKYYDEIDIKDASDKTIELFIAEGFKLYKSNDPDMRQLLTNPEVIKTFGVDFSKPLEEQIDNIQNEGVKNLYKNAANSLQGGTIPSAEEAEKLAIEATAELKSEFKEFLNNLKQEYKNQQERQGNTGEEWVNILEQQKRAAEIGRIEQARVQAEYDSAAYLASELAGKFLDQRAAVTVATLYKSYGLLRSTLSNFSVGTVFQTAANLTNVVSMLSGLVSLFGMKKPDPLLRALEDIHKSVTAMHTEMRQSFDLMFRSQQDILHQLAEVSLNITQMQHKLDVIQETLNLSTKRAREAKRDDVYADLFKQHLNLVTESDPAESNRPNRTGRQETIKTLLQLAVPVSAHTELTRSEIEQWQPAAIKRELCGSLISVEDAVGTLPAIYNEIFERKLVDSDDKEIRMPNLVFFTKAVSMLSQAAHDFSDALNPTLREEVNTHVKDVFDKTELVCGKVFSPEFIEAFRGKLIQAFEAAINPHLRESYVRLEALKADALPKESMPADIYAFNPPQWSVDGKMEYEVRHDINSGTSSVELDKQQPADTTIYNCFYNRKAMTKCDVLELAQLYGFLSSADIGKFSNFGFNGRSYSATFPQYDETGNKVFKEFSFAKVQGHGIQANYYYCRSHGNENYKIAMQLSKDDPKYATMGEFLDYFQKHMVTHYSGLQREYINRVEKRIENDQAAVLQFEALVAAFSYLVGLHAWLRSGKLADSGNLVFQSIENLMGLRSILRITKEKGVDGKVKEVASEYGIVGELKFLLDPKNRPKDPEDKRKPLRVDKLIHEYAAEQLRAKFVSNLDRTIAASFGQGSEIAMPDYLIAKTRFNEVIAKARQNESPIEQVVPGVTR